jgi:aminoglycoside phosphotransferase (APT) family kinase protein
VASIGEDVDRTPWSAAICSVAPETEDRMPEIDPDTMATPWRRDPAETEPALQRWVEHAVGRGVVVSDVGEPGNGMSSETALFTITHPDGRSERLVARLAPKPDVYPVFETYDLAMQRGCMDLVRARTAAPAPVCRWLETDPSWLGTPFLVMERIDGESPPDIPPYVFGGWLMDATPAQRDALVRNSVQVLAEVHTLHPGNADLSFLMELHDGASAMTAQLDAQRAYYEWARDGVTYPLIERTLDWLEANRPPERGPVLNWGDSRIGNMLYRDFTPVAVLDWEMATVGPREVDVAWMVFLHRFFQDLAERFELPGIPGFMDPTFVCATYEELTGYQPTDLHWYEVFGALRFAIVSVRTSTRGIAYGQMEAPADPDDLIMFRALLEGMIS